MKNKKIAVFGDSILKGVITVPNSGRIFDVVENDSLTQAQKVLGFELTNNSIYGNVITKAKGKFEKFIQKQKDANNLPDIVIIEFGNNDCDYDWNSVSDATNFSEILPKTPLNDFLENHDVKKVDIQYQTLDQHNNGCFDTVVAFYHVWYE